MVKTQRQHFKKRALNRKMRRDGSWGASARWSTQGAFWSGVGSEHWRSPDLPKSTLRRAQRAPQALPNSLEQHLELFKLHREIKQGGVEHIPLTYSGGRQQEEQR